MSTPEGGEHDATRRLIARLTGAGAGAPAGRDEARRAFDGADLTAAGLRRAGLLADPAPAWWDAAEERVRCAAARLTACSLRSANLSTLACNQVDLTGADLADAALSGAQLGDARFDGALLEDADLRSAHLRFASFRDAVLEGARLGGADLRGAVLAGAQLQNADLRAAQLEEADLRGARAEGADLRGARLVLADLRGADLRGADLQECIVRGAKLGGADLRNARLQHLDLTACAIAGVRLADAQLEHTRLHRSQLGGTVGEEGAGEYELARRAYLTLERNFLDVGDPDAASWSYRRRRRVQKRHALQQARQAARRGAWREAAASGLQGAADEAVELSCDYGESVGRVMATMAAVFVAFAAWYWATGSVVRDGGASGPAGVAGAAAASAGGVVRYTLMAMLSPGGAPAGLRAATPGVEMVNLLQSFVSIFLIGLLGFVAGNRIRR